MESLLLLGIGLLLLALLLMVLEAFVPSGGILGIGAGISAIAGIVFLFKHDPMWGASGLLVTVILGPMAFISSIKMLPNTPIGRIMVGRSGEEIAEEKQAAQDAARRRRSHLLEQEGTALTPMRPSGVVEINGERHDAIARGGLIESGNKVRVVKVDGLTIEVRPLS